MCVAQIPIVGLITIMCMRCTATDRAKQGALSAQALYWAWSHAIPLRLQRPAGDSSRLPTAAPVGSPSKMAAVAGPGLCSSLASPSTEAATIPVSAPCSSGVPVAAFSEQDDSGQWMSQLLLTVLRPSLQLLSCHHHNLHCWLQALKEMLAAAALRVTMM